MERLLDWTGSPRSVLSAAKPGAAEVDQASLVTRIRPCLEKSPLGCWEVDFHQQMGRRGGRRPGEQPHF